MANTITDLIPDAYQGIDIVAREISGLIPAVTLNASAESAGKDDSIIIPKTQSQSAAAITPAVSAPDTGDQTIGNSSFSIDKAYQVPIRWEGEQKKSYMRNGTMTSTFADQVAQAARTLVNLIEADIAAEYYKASRAYGTAGTTPFATDLSAMAQIRKILIDNGAPQSDLQCVVNTTAGASLRSLVQLTNVNNAGSSATLRDGVLLPVSGFDLRESSQIKAHTKGTATGFDANGGEPVGETTIVVDGSDSGTILAGDVVTWVGDDNKYLVQSATASGAATGNITIAEPGMVEALATTVEGTIGSSYAANMAFHRSAIQLATRIPAGADDDMADDRVIITDPLTGISFELARYKQYRQVHYELGIAWGTVLNKPEFAALLLG